ncbi:MAG: PAS domain-containing sensor histidine kinase [Bacteroidia bacterium]|nr:PAS domain-containing sensor histidine kinase [Bacteroidia bacterium]
MDSLEGAEALFLHASEGIVVVNQRGEMVRCNPSACIMFGFSQEEMLGNRVEMLVPQKYAGSHAARHDAYTTNPEPRKMGANRDLFARRKDGSEFPVEISLSPFTRNNEKYVIAFVVDITLRKQAEEKLHNYSADLERQVRNRTLILEEAIDELQKTKDQLHAALEKERELNELKTRFVSMASHEFRTPLATMLSSLSLVTKYGETNDKDKQAKHVQRIKNSITHLNDILNDLLSVSKLEEGKLTQHPEPTQICPFIAEVLTELKPLAGTDVLLVSECHCPEEITIDSKLLKHILFNLVSNAIKYSPAGKTVSVNAGVEDNELVIHITDQGIGIPEEDQKHLFTRFFRGRNAAHIPGTGLGLHIVAKHTELMNGSVTFVSRENHGTTFTLRFPQ